MEYIVFIFFIMVKSLVFTHFQYFLLVVLWKCFDFYK